MFFLWWWTVALPMVCLFSALTNAMSIFVLCKMRISAKATNMSYTLIRYKSTAYSAYSLICVFFYATKRGDGGRPTLQSTYALQFYEAYVYSYLGRAVVMFGTLVEVWIAAERLLLLKKLNVVATAQRRPSSRGQTSMCVALWLASLLVYSPFACLIRIRSNAIAMDNTSVVYRQEFAVEGARAARLLLGTLSSLRSWLTSLVIVILTALICLSIQKRTNCKLRMHHHITKTASSISINQLLFSCTYIYTYNVIESSPRHFLLSLA